MPRSTVPFVVHEFTLKSHFDH